MLPNLWNRDLLNLSKVQMAMLGFKVWVTYNFLDEKKKRG
jgi:hypothetical protein